MQDKQKVTLYLPPDLHRELKIRAAVETEPMSVLAERALSFYLHHSEIVDRVERHGHTHQVYACPMCASSLLVRDGQLATVGQEPSILADDHLSINQVYPDDLRSNPESASEETTEKLVTC